VEGVEMQLDVVVARDAIAVGEGRRDGARIGKCADAEVNRVAGIPDAHLGGIRRGAAVGGLVE
jgi:hypothetical protein